MKERHLWLKFFSPPINSPNYYKSILVKTIENCWEIWYVVMELINARARQDTDHNPKIFSANLFVVANSAVKIPKYHKISKWCIKIQYLTYLPCKLFCLSAETLWHYRVSVSRESWGSEVGHRLYWEKQHKRTKLLIIIREQLKLNPKTTFRSFRSYPRSEKSILSLTHMVSQIFLPCLLLRDRVSAHITAIVRCTII